MDSRLLLQAVILKGGFRRYWAVWLLCLLLAAIDLSSRFLIFSPEENGRYSSTAQEVLIVPALGGDTLDQYLSKLSKHQEVEDPKPEDSGGIEAAAAPTNLGFWAASDYSYQLLAVFRASRAFAVVSRSSVGSDEKEIIELKVGELVSDFVVSEITGSGLVLEGPDEARVELLLFRSIADLLDQSNI